MNVHAIALDSRVSRVSRVFNPAPVWHSPCVLPSCHTPFTLCSQDGVLRVLEDVLDSGYLRLYGGGVAGQPGTVGGQLTIPRHPNFRLLIAQNSARAATYGATRHVLGVSLLSHFVPVAVAPLETEQLSHIVAARLQECAAPANRGRGDGTGEEDDADPGGSGEAQSWAQRCAAALVAVHTTTEAAARAERSKHGPTLRDLLQA